VVVQSILAFTSRFNTRLDVAVLQDDVVEGKSRKQNLFGMLFNGKFSVVHGKSHLTRRHLGGLQGSEWV